MKHIGITLAFLFLAQMSVLGLDPGDVSIALTSGSLVMIDNNKPCLPDREGPLSGYITFEVCNTSGQDLTGLKINLDTFTNSSFALQGGQSSLLAIGTLEKNSCKTYYWYITWPCTDGTSSDITVTASDNDSGTISHTATITTEEANSSSAGGILVSKVLGPGAAVGQLIFFDVVYDFGNIKVGDEFSFQPLGNEDFRGDCFQLVNLEITYSDVNSLNVGVQDQLFFISTATTNGSGNEVHVRYYFKYLCLGVSSTARPYAFSRSGNQLKYSPNYNSQIPETFPTAINPFSISKSVSPDSVGLGDTAVYTITIENTSAYDVSIDTLTDFLPGPLSFRSILASSDISMSNSTQTPINGDVDSLYFISGVPATFPSSEYFISAGDSISLVYSVDVALGTLPETYDNSVFASAGSFRTNTVSAELCILCIRCVLPCTTFPYSP